MNTRYLVFILITLFLGCATIPESEEVLFDAEMNSLQRINDGIATILPAGQLSRSVNGREIISNYYGNKKQINKSDKLRKEQRNQVVIKVLGDRRPYAVSIVVRIENRVGDTNGNWQEYEEVGLDLPAAQEIARRLGLFLKEAKIERNVIDDFRAF